MTQLSLSDTLRLHRASGRRSMMPVMHDNEIELFLRDASSGEVQGRVKKKNLSTRVFHQWLAMSTEYAFTNLYLVISNDLTAMHLFKTAWRSTYPNAMTVAASISVDNTAKTWTCSGTFTAPSSNRTFQLVGLSPYAEYNPSTNNRFANPIICGTRLTSPLIQTTTQTLEIVYRLQFVRI